MVKVTKRRAPDVSGDGTGRENVLLRLDVQLSTLLTSARAFTAETAANFEPAVSGVSFQVLQRLYSLGEIRSMRIAEALAVDRSALSRLLRQLTQANLVKARPDPLDGRVAIYGLTAHARRKMDAAIFGKENRFFERLQDWSVQDIRELARLLERLNGPGDE